ncbi:MAG TPA: caspase family protein [Thermoanaerobaculia bacterium]|nr:caspase family protein [Thermoanaerobaculia bacterium]
MPIGMSIHVGLNALDPKHYGGWSGPLRSAVADAVSMEAIADEQKFQTVLLKTADATVPNFRDSMAEAARRLDAGDLLLVTYAGHGSQVPDTNGDEGGNGTAGDGQDETWCMFDRQLVDDELYTMYGKFTPGVRILVLSDSCHSGSVVRASRIVTRDDEGNDQQELAVDMLTPRGLPLALARRVYVENRKCYDEVQEGNLSGERTAVAASIILISGCMDHQEAGDGAEHGTFTAALLDVWNDGKFRGGLRPFWKQISKRVAEIRGPLQSPNYFRAGVVNPVFERQKPFTI